MTYAKDGILDEDPKNILINTAFKHDCRGAEIFIPALQIADLAWALALKKVGALKNNELIKALCELQSFELNPEYGDIYNSKNVALKQLTPYAQDLHISRPRREAINIAFYLLLKDEIVNLSYTLKNLAKTFIKTARKNDVIMSDYTYLQQAQPTTFSHYILTFLFPLFRDFERIELLYNHLNLSVAGSGSVNGCSFDIDREYLAKLLNCAGVEYHSRDAMWRSDIPIETIYILNSIMANISRVVDELQIFSTTEFGLVQLPASLSRASVIMPNKQNPYALTYIRGVTNEMLGKMTSFISYEKIVSGNPDSRTFVYVDLIESIKKVRDTLELFRVVLDDLEVKEKLEQSFSYATDLAEYLIQTHGLTYEEAHTEVGRVIRYMRNNNISPYDIQESFFNYSIDLSLIDPKQSIQRKKTVGSVGKIEEIFKIADTKIQEFNLTKNDFSFLENQLKDMGYEIKLTT